MVDYEPPNNPAESKARIRARLSVKKLRIYFNDHLAGSVAALSLVDDLAKTENPDFAAFTHILKAKIEEDQRLLKKLIEELGGDESSVKTATAWVGEKLAAIKLDLHPQDEDSLGTMEALEVLALGIEGKRLMWLLLKEIDFDQAVETPVDLNRLAGDAQIQREDVENWRQWWGKKAMVRTPR